MSIKKRKQEIKNLVAAANIGEAIKRLLDLCRDFCPEKEDDAILLSNRWNALCQAEQKRTIEHNHANIERGKISNALLSQIATIRQEDIHSAMLSPEEQLIALTEEIRQRPISDKIVVQLEDIHKEYKSSGFELSTTSLQLQLGAVAGLVGENATGKTSLLRILAGDLAQDKGNLSYPLWQKIAGNNWRLRKEKIAYIPQNLVAWENNLESTLKYEAAIHDIKGKANQKEVQYIIARLDLKAHCHKAWQQLSGGYKLRFALAKALIKKPQLLILDEPLAHLDIKTQWSILNDIKNLSKSTRYPMGIIISSQHIAEIEAIADSLYYMDNGTVEALGSTTSIGKDRTYNLFEFACAQEYAVIKQKFADFPKQNLWYNGFHFFLKTDRQVTSTQVITHLQDQAIEIQLFSDISSSVKTKFYEAHL